MTERPIVLISIFLLVMLISHQFLSMMRGTVIEEMKEELERRLDKIRGCHIRGHERGERASS